MKKILILSLCSFQCVFGNLEHYFSYIKQLGQSVGNCHEGEIEVVLDPVEISRIQDIQEQRLLKKGFSEANAKEFTRIGVVSEDQYWIWLRDAVYFPDGVTGTYDRLLCKSKIAGGLFGVAVLPVLPSGQIVLILTHRHATRSWELELPRGGVEPGETSEEGAFRELKEETGFIASSLIYLGEMANDTGVLSSVVPVYLGKISSQGNSDFEESEAIAALISFTKEELKAGLIQGSLEVTLQGKKMRVPLRDAYLTFALLQAECRKLL